MWAGKAVAELAGPMTKARRWLLEGKVPYGTIELQDSTVTGAGSKRKMAPPPALASVLEGAFNSSQRSAVSAGLNAGSRLVLVQGPPGSLRTLACSHMLPRLCSCRCYSGTTWMPAVPDWTAERRMVRSLVTTSLLTTWWCFGRLFLSYAAAHCLCCVNWNPGHIF